MLAALDVPAKSPEGSSVVLRGAPAVAGAGLGGSAAPPGQPRRPARRGDGFPFPVQPRPAPVLHRHEPVGRPARQGHYDLLASEACLASFLAVARGDVPRRHWFQLGRLSTRVAGRAGLISWGGTMFEYLMPRLLLPIPKGTLLDVAERAAIARQIEYGRQVSCPGASPSRAFNALDATNDYQYQSFGVPGLGLKRGLGQDRVIAPYATLLAIPLARARRWPISTSCAPKAAEGSFGFYEAIDYTPSRLLEGVRSQIVRCWMAHHQGMGLIAIANRLTGDAMPRRFRRSRPCAPPSCCCKSACRTMRRS